MRVLVEEKDGEKALGFEYIKADAPIRPRGPDESRTRISILTMAARRAPEAVAA